MHQNKITEKYHWPIKKYDADKEAVVGIWGPDMTVA